MNLPPEDRARSPHTGWTRAHWEAVADVLLEGLRPHVSPAGAFVHVPGARASWSGDRSDGLEGYARSFLLAAFRVAGAGGDDPRGHLDRYARGLAAGTDPASPEAWPAIDDGAQAMVEAASIAIALHETRPWFWDHLDGAVRERCVAWLSAIAGKLPCPNNWLLFQVTVGTFLQTVGAPYPDREIEANLDLVDSWYRRDGWYADGPGEDFDHYAGWAMHLYLLLWCRMDGDRRDPARAAVYRARAERFLRDARHLIGGDGAPLHQGRSLVYRFAAAAPLWAAALLGCSPLAAGETRRAASGMLRHFLERGACRDGVLTLGWHGEFLPLAQPYSGPASPYWASKAFLGLLLPPGDPVWTAVEEALPAEQADACVAMPAPGLLVASTASDGIVRVLNHRSHHVSILGTPDDDHYDRLAYSTATGPELGGPVLDSHVAIVRAGGVSRRGAFRCLGVADCFAASVHWPEEGTVIDGRWASQWWDRIETAAIALGGPLELRISHAAGLRPFGVRDAGWAVAGSGPVDVATGDGWALARAGGSTSAIVDLTGGGRPAVATSEGTNAFGRYSGVPYLDWPGPHHAATVVASLVVLTGEPFDPEVARAAVDVEIEGRLVRATTARGDRFLVQLVEPEGVDIRLGPVRMTGPLRYARASRDGTTFRLRAV